MSIPVSLYVIVIVFCKCMSLYIYVYHIHKFLFVTPVNTYSTQSVHSAQLFTTINFFVTDKEWNKYTNIFFCRFAVLRTIAKLRTTANVTMVTKANDA